MGMKKLEVKRLQRTSKPSPQIHLVETIHVPVFGSVRELRFGPQLQSQCREVHLLPAQRSPWQVAKAFTVYG